MQYHTIIVGAGAAGLFCASNLAQHGKKVAILDHAKRIGEKIRISGGGRCNFTNVHVDVRNFLSGNPHFARSALSRFTPADFIELIEQHGIEYYEKDKGQLFTKHGAQQIVDLLLKECEKHSTSIYHPFKIESLSYNEGVYSVNSDNKTLKAKNLVIATGGLSIPKIGATDLGYRIAKQFNHTVIEPLPALVPLIINPHNTSPFTGISGVSLTVDARVEQQHFVDQMLCTHGGLSGPAILQISSYWQFQRRLNTDATISIALVSDEILEQWHRQYQSRNTLLNNALASLLPKRLADSICTYLDFNPATSQLSKQQFSALKTIITNYTFNPTKTVGFKKAEVTLGGVSCDELSSKTMESMKQQGLYFIGEVVDVTGHLGGYNFQWAWSSAYAAALALSQR